MGGKTSREAGSPPLWSPGGSQLVLLLAGVVAWICALGLAVNDKSGEAASIFVGGGTALIAAAAFFDRVRHLGIHGVDVDPLSTVQGVDAGLPPPSPDTTPERERQRVFDALERSFEGSVEDGVRMYSQELVEDRVDRWLSERGHTVRRPLGAVDVDMVAVPDDGEVFAIDVRTGLSNDAIPTPEKLRRGFLKAQDELTSDLEDRGFRPYVAIDGDLPSRILDRYRREGIGVLRVDPHSADVQEVVSPDDLSGQPD